MKKSVAEILLREECFQLNPQNPFTYASGLKGPIYCDNRLILSQVEAREEIIESFLSCLSSFITSHPPFDLIAGMATAGIPHAAWLAHHLKKPLIYVRTQAKGHGMAKLIEGRWKKSERVILIEDLVNQGQSSCVGLDALIDGGLNPVGLICIVDYEMKKARQEIAKRTDFFQGLTNFSTLVEVAFAKGIISSNDLDLLRRWHDEVTSNK